MTPPTRPCWALASRSALGVVPRLATTRRWPTRCSNVGEDASRRAAAPDAPTSTATPRATSAARIGGAYELPPGVHRDGGRISGIVDEPPVEQAPVERVPLPVARPADHDDRDQVGLEDGNQ